MQKNTFLDEISKKYGWENFKPEWVEDGNHGEETRWTCRLRARGVEGKGKGGSKRVARIQASKSLLKKLDSWLQEKTVEMEIEIERKKEKKRGLEKEKVQLEELKKSCRERERKVEDRERELKRKEDDLEMKRQGLEKYENLLIDGMQRKADRLED